MPLTVALVDDDAAMRERVAQAVAGSNEVELIGAFADARSALAFLAQRAPDVMLVDLGLPDLPGLAVITYCAQRHPGTDIMVLTVFEDAAHVLQSIKAGASGYLLKDSLNDEIVRHIRQLRDGGAPMTPSIARQLLAHVRPPLEAEGAPGHAPSFLEFSLTPTEKTVLNLIARGFKYAEIGKLNGVSVHTVHSHIKNIYAKLSVNSRSEAVFEASRLGLLEGVLGADRPG
jgi:DNA-binding NarL/FixJ family response regulator